MKYKIESKAGIDLGIYEGDNEAQALLAFLYNHVGANAYQVWINKEGNDLRHSSEDYESMYGYVWSYIFHEFEDHPKIMLNGGQFDFDAVVMVMDEDLRESIHMALAPCSGQEFIDAYCEVHLEKFQQEFTL